MVIAMDLELTDNLVVEGYARDIVRHIQEARKEAGYQVDDRILISLPLNSKGVPEGGGILKKILEKF